MKGLSIEEKAERYDKAFKVAENICRFSSDLAEVKRMKEIFPELVESNDEKIRKVIYGWICTQPSQFFDSGFSKEEMLAWLKKQGKDNIGISEVTKQKLEDNLNKALEKETPESWNEFLDEKKPYGQRQECVDCQMNYAGECKGSCAMKRSEQNLAEKYNITGIGSKNAQGKLGEMIKNLTDKFKVGDWVVYQNQTFQVTKGSGNNLILQGRRYQTYFIEGLCKPWTIKDAKPGDVIVNGSNIFIFSHLSDTRAMGYCHINLDDRRFYDDKGKNECFGLIDAVFTPATKEQCDTLKKAIHEAGYMWDTEGKQLVSLKAEPSEWSREDEQNLNAVLGFIDDEYLRRWLKDAIHVRYDKQGWSEEDETTKNNISHIIRQYDKISKKENQPCYYVGDCLLWMQNIKDRVQPQPKQEWSALDEKNLQGIIDEIQANKNNAPDYDLETYDRFLSWLKSIRDRYTWKPSKEQIIALRWVLNNVPYCTHKEEINGLLDQIIKL